MINTLRISKVRKATTRITLFVILYLAFFVHLSGQTYPFTNINKDEGLSSPKIYCIIQDIDDYIWLGTGSGLDMFDGKIIEPVTLEDGIWPGGVRCLMEDSQGIIWAGHLNGKISYYDGAGFHRISLDSLEINSDITSFQEIDGRIWFTTSEHGAYSAVFDKNTGVFRDVKQYRGKEGLSDQVTSSYINPGGELFCIAPDIGIRKYAKEEDNFILFKPEGITNHFSTICMLEDSRGNGWYGTYNNGLLYLDKDKTEPRFYDMFDIIKNNWVSYLTEDSKGRVWVGTWGGGVTVFDEGNGVNYNDSNGLGAQKILAIMEDREGNILIASYDNGLFIFKGDHFVNYVNNDRITMFSNNDINALCEDNSGRIWLGNDDGVTLFDYEINQFWLYNSEDFSLGKEIVAIQKDNTGNIWIATRFNGIYRYNFSANAFPRSWEVNQIFNKSPQISSMVVDQENNLWIGTADGVGVWNITLEIGVQYTQGDGLASNSIKTLFVDRDGFVWIGSEGEKGLTRFNPKTVQFSIIELKDDISPSSIAQTDDGTIWFGTTSGVYSLVNDSISEHISVRNGLLSNDIQLLQPDREGSLYIGTNSGLNRYNLSTKNITAFTEKNGFTGVQANLNASILAENGHLWFGTEKGVILPAS